MLYVDHFHLSYCAELRFDPLLNLHVHRYKLFNGYKIGFKGKNCFYLPGCLLS